VSAVAQLRRQIDALVPLLRLLPPSAAEQAHEHVEVIQTLRIDESGSQDEMLDPDDWKGGEPAWTSPIKGTTLRDAIFDWDRGLIDGAELVAIAGTEQRKGRIATP
jgi:hypothetical protein